MRLETDYFKHWPCFSHLTNDWWFSIWRHAWKIKNRLLKGHTCRFLHFESLCAKSFMGGGIFYSGHIGQFLTDSERSPFRRILHVGIYVMLLIILVRSGRTHTVPCNSLWSTATQSLVALPPGRNYTACKQIWAADASFVDPLYPWKKASKDKKMEGLSSDLKERSIE